MPVTFHRLAAAEYVTARRWYAARNANAAGRFVAEFNAAVGRIDLRPAVGSPWAGAIRWVRVRRYPYLLYFEEVSPGNVFVYAVAHARRRQGYWVRRVGQR